MLMHKRPQLPNLARLDRTEPFDSGSKLRALHTLARLPGRSSKSSLLR